MYRIIHHSRNQQLRRKLDREMHSAFIEATAEWQRQPSQAWYDMRRGRQFWWGPLSTKLAEMRELGAPKEKTRQIAEALAEYIDALYDEPRPTQAA